MPELLGHYHGCRCLVPDSNTNGLYVHERSCCIREKSLVSWFHILLLSFSDFHKNICQKWCVILIIVIIIIIIMITVIRIRIIILIIIFSWISISASLFQSLVWTIFFKFPQNQRTQISLVYAKQILQSEQCRNGIFMKYAYSISKSINHAVDMICETKHGVNLLESSKCKFYRKKEMYTERNLE